MGGHRAAWACRAHRHIRQLQPASPAVPDHADDAGFSKALPWQAQHQRVELRARQWQRARPILGPGELADVQAPGGQPHADAVMHQHLHAVGSLVRKEVGMVRVGLAEDLDHARQCGLGAHTHVQRLDCQPQGVHADHCSNSRSQAAQPLAAEAGQLTVISVAPRLISMRMSGDGSATVGSGTDTKAGLGDTATGTA
jgi:hypothetical protein